MKIIIKFIYFHGIDNANSVSLEDIHDQIPKIPNITRRLNWIFDLRIIFLHCFGRWKHPAPITNQRMPHVDVPVTSNISEYSSRKWLYHSSMIKLWLSLTSVHIFLWWTWRNRQDYMCYLHRVCPWICSSPWCQSICLQTWRQPESKYKNHNINYMPFLKAEEIYYKVLIKSMQKLTVLRQ